MANIIIEKYYSFIFKKNVLINFIDFIIKNGNKYKQK